ncbi:MAG TPA: DinB family protein [Ktedonobacteraceae bacterium]|nr:DinB family protein [Ktedonobacteraceae bacterium]
MAEQETNLLPFYKGWDVYQDLLVKTLAPLTDEQLELRAAPHLRSIGQNAVHIVATRAGWFHGLMQRGDAEIAVLAEWNDRDLNAPIKSATELVAGLETTWKMIEHALANWTPADLEYVYEGKWDDEPYRLTRQWVIWHVIEHDLHHGGEISFTLGMHNLPAIDI